MPFWQAHSALVAQCSIRHLGLCCCTDDNHCPHPLYQLYQTKAESELELRKAEPGSAKTATMLLNLAWKKSMSFYREEYCFVSWRQIPEREGDEEQGVEPDLPDHIHCELLAFMGNEPVSGLHYPALGLVRWPKNESAPQGVKPVSEELAVLLEAGVIYPPAIAIARDAVGWLSGTEDASEAAAVERFTNALRDELENQRNRPFFLEAIS